MFEVSSLLSLFPETITCICLSDAMNFGRSGTLSFLRALDIENVMQNSYMCFSQPAETDRAVK